MNFCPPAVPRNGTGGGKRFRNSALAEYQNRKIFISLIEKIFVRERLKNVKKIFLFCSGGSEADAGRKRWAGLSPAGRQSEVSIRILGEISSDFVQKVPPIFFNLMTQKLLIATTNPAKIREYCKTSLKLLANIDRDDKIC